MDNSNLTEQEKRINTIKALLSKTVERGCSQEESLTSLAKARALMDAYEITDEDLELTKAETAILREEPPGTADPHGIKFGLAFGVALFTDTRAWRNPKAEGNGLVFCGLPSDVQFATWLLDHLTRFVQGELVNHLMTEAAALTGMPRRKSITGFVDGITQSIVWKLKSLSQPAPSATSNGRALVVAKQAIIEAKIAELGFKMRKHSSGRQFDTSAYEAGSTAAGKASFGRPVSGKAGALRLGDGR